MSTAGVSGKKGRHESCLAEGVHINAADNVSTAPVARSQGAVYRRITRTYVWALGLIAVCASLVFLSVHLLILSQDESAHLINVSGRQRMLSQQIALLAREYAAAATAQQRARIEGELRQALARFSDSHRALTQGDPAQGLRAPRSQAVRDLYHGENALNADVKWFVGEVEALLLASPDQLSSDGAAHARLDRLSEFARHTLLARLNAVVAQNEAEANRRVKMIRVADIIVFAGTLFGLLCEALFIFRPMARAVTQRTRELQEARDQLNYQANHDELTGLPNRRYLRVVAGEHFAPASPKAVLQIDLDGF
ncbi:MAG: type IV pili methyl-accepting chemotaxis transducer N-terminal domain-containing protein, partial [Pseudomonadota bacterium]